MKRHTLQRSASRRGFTLLEVLLASSIAVLIMYGVYMAIDLHTKYSDTSRHAVEDGTLGRSIMARINSDVTSCVGLPDPGRYRNNTAGSSASSSSSTPSSTTPSTSPESTTPSDTTMPEPEDNAELIRAFTGRSNYVQVYVSRVAGGQWLSAQGNTTAAANVLSDQRLIVYWLAEGGGLCRQEITAVTGSGDTQPIAMGTGDEARYVIAPEVLSLEFSYFDGSGWTDTWDGRTIGQDNATPQGPPVAVAVTITVNSAFPDRDPLTLRQVIFIPASNGAPQPTDEMPADPSMGNAIP